MAFYCQAASLKGDEVTKPITTAGLHVHLLKTQTKKMYTELIFT